MFGTRKHAFNNYFVGDACFVLSLLPGFLRGVHRNSAQSTDDERKEVLSRIDSLLPESAVNCVLKFVLATLENGAAVGISRADDGKRKKQCVKESANRHTSAPAGIAKASVNRDTNLLARPWSEGFENTTANWQR